MTSCFRGHTHLDSDKLLVMSIVVLILCVAEGEEPVLAGVGMNAVPIMY